MTRAICIYNPASRRAPSQNVLDDLRARFLRHRYAVEFQPTRYPLHGTELARAGAASGAEIVIACGGDGTINEIVHGMAGSPTPLAILPSGAANVLAKELRLPRNPLKIPAALPAWKPLRIALGKCGTYHFILMAGAGFDASVINRMDDGMKQRYGTCAFIATAIRQWWAGPFPAFHVSIDGKPYTCTFAVVGRAKLYGTSLLRITPNADLRSNRFDVTLFQGGSRPDYLRYFASVLTGTHSCFRDVTSAPAEVVEISADPPVRIQMDGELRGFSPARLEIVPDGLTLMAPPEFLARS
jgi:diacylglycerol kinase (ATP)